VIHHLWRSCHLLRRRWSRVCTHGIVPVVHHVVLVLVLKLVSLIVMKVISVRPLIVTSIVHISGLVLLMIHLMRHVATTIHHIAWSATMPASHIS
jgi:hypothetical protein